MGRLNLFGTDGIRGTSNSYPMTTEMALKLGMAAGCFFKNGSQRHTVVIGKDTRLSGYMLEPALTAGFISVGMDVVLVGPIPTPGIAILTRSLRCDLGVMLSASHNSFEDNGIKLFGPNGFKLSDAHEREIELLMAENVNELRVSPKELGRARRLDDGIGAVRYIESVKNTFPRDKRLDSLKVVVDCAHGAAYKVAPDVLWELGAEVVALGVSPDGFNINQNSGSVNPENLIAKVKEVNADFGLALDGDGDRIVACDEKGNLIDGDQILAVIASKWHSTGELAGNALVGTVMSNLALERFLHSKDLELKRAQVGDRHVSAMMEMEGLNLGGEQSGHIILGRHATTGDGLMAGLQLLAILVDSDKPASEGMKTFQPVPQIIKNITVADYELADKCLRSPSILRVIKDTEKALGVAGRLLIRKSGTESLIRIMGEGDNADKVLRAVETIVDVMQDYLSKSVSSIENLSDKS